MRLRVSPLCGALVLLLLGCSGEGIETQDGYAGTGEGLGGVSPTGNGGQRSDADADGGADASADTGSDAGAGGEGEQSPTAGSAGASTSESCQVDGDCPAIETVPEGCSEGRCDTQTGTCSYVGVDADGDSYRVRLCQAATAGVVVEAGEDCDDDDPKVSPAGWDGPGNGDLADGCNDGLDNDCSGSVDDGQLENGSTCKCTPGQTMPCSLTPSGLAIVYPALDADGRPLGNCRLGSLTCDSRGNWDECTGAQGPVRETCNGNDNDCDGIPSSEDEDVIDPLSWSYDVDNDGYRLLGTAVHIGCEAPADVPSACLALCTDCEAECPASGWQGQLSARPDGDCNDNAVAINPGVKSELCNGIDDDCDGTTDPDCDCIGTEERTCGLIDPTLDGIGECHFGTQQCTDGHWSNLCVGAQDREVEQCGEDDHDCDGVKGDDDEDAINKTHWVCDADGDGYALTTGAVEVSDCAEPDIGAGSSCDGPAPDWLEDPNPAWLADCNDQDASFGPDESETCDGEDNDCDGEADNNAATDACDISGQIETAQCVDAQCVVNTCQGAYLNCNGEFSCETDGAVDPDHCGNCDTECFQRCASSACDEFVQIAGGSAHTCARTRTGRILCWGENDGGQLGDTTVAPRWDPTATANVSNAIDLDVGWDTSCAMSSTTAWCWGANDYGELGNTALTPGSTTFVSTPAAVAALSEPTAITVGRDHACAVHSGGHVACWGRNHQGQLGNTLTSDDTTPQTVVNLSATGPLTNAIAVAAGRDHSCAIVGASASATQGQVVCWGDNGQSQLGDNVTDHGTVCSAGDCTSRPVAVVGPAADPRPLSDAVQLSAGDRHTCAVRQSGQVVCWGRNLEGQLGDGTEAERAAFVNAAGVTDATEVKARSSHTCARNGNQVACWGLALDGQLGDDQSHDTCAAGACSLSAVTLGTPVDSVSTLGVGFQHSCALHTSGEPFCWGEGSSGRLGNGTEVDHPTPFAVSREPD